MLRFTGAGKGRDCATAKMMLAEGANVLGMDIFENDLHSLQEKVKRSSWKIKNLRR